MSIKRYCDVCGEEMASGYGVYVLRRSRLDVKIEIKVMEERDRGRPDVCVKCVLEIANNGAAE